jgi:hypothetical protein
MIDTSMVRVHQRAACIAHNRKQSMGRSRGGLTSKLAANYLAFIQLASIRLWLRVKESAP